MAQDYFKGEILNENIVTTTNSDAVEVRSAKTVLISGYVAITTPSAVTTLPPAIALGSETITKTAHGLMTGNKVQAAVSSTLPAGTSATDYYAIVVDANTIKLAASYADSLVPTPINITSVGVGQAGLTPQTFANKNFADTDVAPLTDICTVTGHGLITGTAFTLTTAGTLPDPLAVLTTYYAIVVDANNIKIASSLANAQVGTPINLADAGTGTFTIVPATYAAKSFYSTDVNTTAESITITGHGFFKGLKITLAAEATLPTPLLAVTDYFVIKVDANNFKLATTLNLALAGTPLDFTDQGKGLLTLTPVALAGGSAKLQYTLETDVEAPVWYDAPAATVTNPSQSITGAVLLYWEKIDPPYAYIRVQCTATAGQYNPTLSVLVKK